MAVQRGATCISADRNRNAGPPDGCRPLRDLGDVRSAARGNFGLISPYMSGVLHFRERSVTPAEASDERRVARLVESGRDLVGLFARSSAPSTSRRCCGCAPAIAPAAATSRPPSGNLARAAVALVRRLCARLRLPLRAAARRRAAHRPVRHLALQRHGRPLRRHRRRAKLCRAMGHRALRAGQGRQLRHREKHRQGHRAHHRASRKSAPGTR